MRSLGRKPIQVCLWSRIKPFPIDVLPFLAFSSVRRHLRVATVPRACIPSAHCCSGKCWSMRMSVPSVAVSSVFLPLCRNLSLILCCYCVATELVVLWARDLVSSTPLLPSPARLRNAAPPCSPVPIHLFMLVLLLPPTPSSLLASFAPSASAICS